MNYWLFKTDPEDFSLEDLRKSPGQRTNWNGVRNYQARNFLRDGIKKGDMVLFYYSNDEPPAITAICEVVKEGYADQTQFDADSRYFFPSAETGNPVWYQVDIKFKRAFKLPVTLPGIKNNPKLKDFTLIKRGNRLSVFPVSEKEFFEILKMAGEEV